MTTIYLYDDERVKFEALPANLRDGWTVESETLQSFEKPEQLRMRYFMMADERFGVMQSLARDVLEGKPLEKLNFDDVPDEFLPKFYFTIGARGVHAIITDLLERVETDRDVLGLSSFSHIRHQLLELNFSVVSS